MGVSRSGYYKWKNRGRTSRDQKREEVIRLVTEVHKAGNGVKGQYAGEAGQPLTE